MEIRFENDTHKHDELQRNHFIMIVMISRLEYVTPSIISSSFEHDENEMIEI